MKQAIYDQIITNFTAFTFSGGAAMFSEVQKMYGDDKIMEPQIALIAPAPISVEIVGNTTDERAYGFQFEYMELIETTAQSEIDIRINRMSNVEDRVLDYIQKEPNDLVGNVSGVTFKNVRLGSSNYTYQQTANGLAIILNITFNVTVVITPQIL